ncbi:hypothetical protein O3M35_004223 [Rhynocoris fuscipes]|uniref:Dynein heavy chain n=1 Tax=Rhynocoris fuscipes TaxID=488301 RepID=A0AAW1CFR3_9HEMI
MIDPNQKSINHCVLSEFQFILIVQLLRPDRLHTTLVNFALEALGLQFLMPTSFQLNEIFPETTSSEPILIITSPGTDPSKEIISMAESKNRIIQEMVVGPGQEAEILKNLSEASNKGQWILLKNLHLLTSWLPTLEKNLQNLLPHHKNFRLWLTTEEHSNFSIVLLSSCIKITYEAPPGIKRNLERTYADWVLNDKLEKSNLGSRSMFVLAWTHATLQERRTYIPQGWTSFYEFNDTDLSVAIAILKAILSKGESSNVYWEYLYGLYEIAVYGGRINNVYDLRVLSSYLRTFFTPDIIMSNNKKPLISNVMLPRSSNVQDHLDVIKQLPNNDKPEYFGLPKNVNRIWERVSSINTIEQVKFLNQNLTNFDRNGSMKKYSLIISPLLKLWKKLNQVLAFIVKILVLFYKTVLPT